MAQITIAQFQLGFIEYVQKEVIPNVPAKAMSGLPIKMNATMMQWVGGVGATYAATMVERYQGALTMLGVIEGEEQLIDTEKLIEISKAQLASVGGELPFANLKFESEDFDKLAKYLTPATVTL